jgi:hypothetical protein
MKEFLLVALCVVVFCAGCISVAKAAFQAIVALVNWLWD